MGFYTEFYFAYWRQESAISCYYRLDNVNPILFATKCFFYYTFL